MNNFVYFVEVNDEPCLARVEVNDKPCSFNDVGKRIKSNKFKNVVAKTMTV